MDQSIHESEPLVSVIMCSYNAGPFIKEAINSILPQTFMDWELVISDDCSTDGTREWLATLQDPRIRLFLQPTNLGYVANKNFAHQQARGQYLTQLDNDDLCSPGRLEKQVAVVLRQPEIKIVACGYTIIDEKGRQLKTIEPDQEQLIFKKEAEGYPFWFPALLVHRSVFDAIGWYHPFFAGVYGDDIYWTVRANERYPILCLKEAMYHYRVNPNSITNVLNNQRKLIMTAVLDELFRQRSSSQTDWLEKGDLSALLEFESSLLQNKKYMGEQYRIWGAKAVNKKIWNQAIPLLKASFQNNPFNKNWYKTFFYFLRRRFV